MATCRGKSVKTSSITAYMLRHVAAFTTLLNKSNNFIHLIQFDYILKEHSAGILNKIETKRAR